MTARSMKTMFIRLLEKLPELEELYWQHQDHHHGLLPALFANEVARFTREVGQEALAPTGRFADPMGLLQRILDFIEEEAASGDSLRHDIIAGEFIEWLEDADPWYPLIYAHLGPVSRSWRDEFWPQKSE